MNPEKNIDKKSCAILMVKYPGIGKVKSRLARHIGDTYALDLYKLFVRDIISTVEKENINLQIAYTPVNQLPQFKKWLGHNHAYLPQVGDTLGDRLISVFKEAFAGGMEFAIAIGSDIPDLPGNIISEALEKLREFDIVIGPCPDGGYYLVGFQAGTFTEKIFHIDEWSTSNVLNDTIKKIKETGLNYHELPFWTDIDEIDDLKDMFQKNKDASKLRSIKFIKDNPDLFD